MGVEPMQLEVIFFLRILAHPGSEHKNQGRHRKSARGHAPKQCTLGFRGRVSATLLDVLVASFPIIAGPSTLLLLPLAICLPSNWTVSRQQCFGPESIRAVEQYIPPPMAVAPFGPRYLA